MIAYPALKKLVQGNLLKEFVQASPLKELALMRCKGEGQTNQSHLGANEMQRARVGRIRATLELMRCKGGGETNQSHFGANDMQGASPMVPTVAKWCVLWPLLAEARWDILWPLRIF